MVPIDSFEEHIYQNTPERYVSEKIGCDCEILIPCIKYNACISIDGFRMHLSSKSNGGATIVCKPSIQLVVGYENEKYIKGIVKSIETGFNADILKDTI